MSSFRWKRKFDNATDEYFSSHLPLKSTTSRVIYLVLQFINLIYDETELLDFTALALPAGKNLSATYGVYCERKHHCIETFLCIRVPSQQVMENCPAKQTNKQTKNRVLGTRFSWSDGTDEICELPSSGTCLVPQVQWKHLDCALQEPGTRTRGPPAEFSAANIFPNIRGGTAAVRWREGAVRASLASSVIFVPGVSCRCGHIIWWLLV